MQAGKLDVRAHFEAHSLAEKLRLEALTEVLRLRVVDRIRQELGSSYSPSVVSQFIKVPVGEYMLRFGIGCASDQIPAVEGAVDEIVQALQAKGPTAAELEKVTRTWLNEQDARTKTNDYWSERLRDRALDPALDDNGADYVTRVNALTAADVQAAARLFADSGHRLRLALAPAAVAALLGVEASSGGIN